MAVLVLKLSGPFQSWGTTNKRKDHRTDDMPSKSGVIGMLAAAFGRRRDEDLSDLRRLRFGARCDSTGTILRDYQTAHIPREIGGKETDIFQGYRYYLQDACFTVGLEIDDRSFLEECAGALRHPIFQPYLGRRCCVPDPGLVVGIWDGSLESVLRSVEPQVEGATIDKMRICVETDKDGDRMRCDVPISFDFHNRKYSYRMEKELQEGENDVYQQDKA